MKQTDFLVLAVLQAEPLHGYGIVQAIRELTGGAVTVRPGDVYRVLYRMHEAGLLEPEEAEAHGEDTARRTYYRITERGTRVSTEQARLMSDVSAQVLAQSRRAAK